MEAHYAAYKQYVHFAKVAETSGLYREAVKSAVAALPHIEGMMRYSSRYEDREFKHAEAINLVLDFAPLILDLANLKTLEQFLAENKRLQKALAEDQVERLAEARSRLWDNYRLWGYLQKHPYASQRELQDPFPDGRSKWRIAITAWEKMGLVQCTLQNGVRRVALATRMGQVISGKCPACGKTADAPKGMFLEKMKCPECRSEVSFVLLASAVDAGRLE